MSRTLFSLKHCCVAVCALLLLLSLGCGKRHIDSSASRTAAPAKQAPTAQAATTGAEQAARIAAPPVPVQQADLEDEQLPADLNRPMAYRAVPTQNEPLPPAAPAPVAETTTPKTAAPAAAPKQAPPAVSAPQAAIKPLGDVNVVGPDEGLASWMADDFHGLPTASGEPYDKDALTAAHRSLPLGSTVEVTNLANGRSTIVRINDRGPYNPKRIIDLSRAAAEKLGIEGSDPVKVRLRLSTNDAAPVQTAQAPATVPAPTPAPAAAATTKTPVAAPQAEASPAPTPQATASSAPKAETPRATEPPTPSAPAEAQPATPVAPVAAPAQETAAHAKTPAAAAASANAQATATQGPWYVQVGAFQDREAAKRVLSALYSAGYEKSRIQRHPTDGFYRVQAGAFADPAAAAAAMDRLRPDYPGVFVLSSGSVQP
ncbi:MAG: septal ring lytic transglycosylase RlpA family protein [Desulfovibrionaceae bacterium]